MIYLDNAASTLYKPYEVYMRSDSVIKNFSANAGRSGHQPAVKAAELIFSARCTVADFLGIESPENVIFTFGCTDSLNILIRGLFKTSDHIITTCYEHNSVLRPLDYMNHNGVEYTVVFPSVDYYINYNDLKKALKKETKALIVNYVSNVTGLVQEIDIFSDFAQQNGLLLILDCAQAAGVQEIADKNVDYVCCAGHKGLYGPQGIGILGIKNSAPLPTPLRFGGTGSRSYELSQPKDMPEYLESGTLSVQNISALEEGINFVDKNKSKIYKHETELAQILIDNLSVSQIYSPKNAQSGVVAFNIEDEDSGVIADILDKKYGICCRGGFHCAPLVHKMLKTEHQGAVRLSVSAFNTKNEIYEAINAINEIAYSIKK